MSEQADRDALFRAILNSLPICCEECREDPDGAAWQDATTATDAILASDWLAQRDRRVAAEALREFADRFRPGDGNPWALHVRSRARRSADRIERGE